MGMRGMTVLTLMALLCAAVCLLPQEAEAGDGYYYAPHSYYVAPPYYYAPVVVRPAPVVMYHAPPAYYSWQAYRYPAPAYVYPAPALYVGPYYGRGLEVEVGYRHGLYHVEFDYDD